MHALKIHIEHYVKLSFARGFRYGKSTDIIIIINFVQMILTWEYNSCASLDYYHNLKWHTNQIHPTLWSCIHFYLKVIIRTSPTSFIVFSYSIWNWNYAFNIGNVNIESIVNLNSRRINWYSLFDSKPTLKINSYLKSSKKALDKTVLWNFWFQMRFEQTLNGWK